MVLVLEWLTEGAIPAIDVGARDHQRDLCWFLTIDNFGPAGDPIMAEWQAQEIRGGTLWIPIGEATIDQFMEALERGVQQDIFEGQNVYVCARSSFSFTNQGEPVITVLAGAGTFVGPVREGVGIDFSLEAIRRFLLLHDEPEQPVEEPFHSLWAQLHRNGYHPRADLGLVENVEVEPVGPAELFEPTSAPLVETQEAQERAKKLLHLFLTEDQRRSLEDKGCFQVVGQDGKTYLIEKSRHGNVWELEGENRVASYCIVCSHVPLYDQMLGQKLMLEQQLDYFKEVANRSPRIAEGEPDPVRGALEVLLARDRDPNHRRGRPWQYDEAV